MDVLLEEVKTGKVTIQQAGEGQLGDQDAPEVKIETPFLQMVLTRLWDEETQAGSRTLRLSTLTQLGGVERIVRTHLDSVMEKLSSSEREAAARLFRFLVTPTGTKIAFSSRDLVSFTELPEATVEPALALLSSPDVRILRPVAPPPDRPAELRYEIFHDVLASAVLDWRARFVSDQQRVEEERRRAQEEERQRRELAQAQAEAEAERQRAEERNRAARRSLIFAGLTGVIAVVALYALFYARSQQKKAEISFAHMLAVAADLEEESPRERRLHRFSGLSFAERAVSISQSAGGTPSPDTVEALHRAVEVSETLDLPGHSSPIEALAFSPDGQHVASAGITDGVRIWDASSMDELRHFPENPGPCRLEPGILFSLDGKKLACANGFEARVWRNWDSETAKEAVIRPCGPSSNIRRFALSPDGELVSLNFRCGDADPWKVGVWKTSPPDSPELREFPGGQDPIFSPQGERLAVIYDKTVNIWDATTDKIVSIPHNDKISDIAFNADGTRLLGTAGVLGAKIWDASSGALLFHTPLPRQHGKIVSIALSPDRKRLASASEENQIKVWDAFSGRVLWTLTPSGSSSPIYRLFFSSDGSRLLGSSSNRVQMWEAASGAPLASQSARCSLSVQMENGWQSPRPDRKPRLLRISPWR